MSYIEVLPDKCNGCGKCIKSCNFNAIQIINGKAVIDLSLCTLCNVCISRCKFSAIKIVKTARKADIYGYKGIWVVIECFDGEIKNTGFQLASKAIELSKVSKDDVTALLIGNRAVRNEKLKNFFSGYGVRTINLIFNENLSQFIIEDCAQIIPF